MSEEKKQLYFKCTFDCYVALDEETAAKSNTGALRVSTFVGAHLANCLSELEKKQSATTFVSGEITTKVISARQGKKWFEKKRG